ncbi:hypothetical protein PAECIP111890_05752 [Paenibacillus sp. JJ-223]|nr:hypothetical protein PAECIP111890_05752 [Paenibacillus sp. JJ-223]
MDEEECNVGELELGRFKLKEGARLRQDYQTFADLATEFTHCMSSMFPMVSTLSPLMVRDYADRILAGAGGRGGRLGYLGGGPQRMIVD